MDICEELAMMHLTRNGKTKVFVCPQYSVDGERACPDFVALDFERKKVLVVEASGAANPTKLLERTRDRENQWFERLRREMRQSKVVDDLWDFRVMFYIRSIAAKAFQEKLGDVKDVEIRVFEKNGLPWEPQFWE
jgi:hypothetical protein